METPDAKFPSIECPVREICYSSFACSPANIRRGLAPAGLVHYKKGEMIFYGMDADQSVLIVQTGIAVAINYLENGDAMIIGIIGRGVMIGEMEAFFHIKYPYVIKALTPVTICKHYGVHLVKLVKENPDYLSQVVAAIENNDHSLGRQLWIMNAQRVQERVRRTLVILANFQMFDNQNTDLPVTHDDLALLVNTDRPTVSRCLKRLEKDGFVELGYQSMTVLGDYELNEASMNFRFLPTGKNRSLLAD
ncbi:MAG: Crp/Fnr family transcriptional regulator [Anaerolineales bacterium]|nr:Crp/Fnr family transcriptional regulator [Anaerolineales bacterium]